MALARRHAPRRHPRIPGVDRRARPVPRRPRGGAGLDSFAQRHSGGGVRIFEVDQPGTQDWKRRRLAEIGYPPGDNLSFVPVDFEGGESWPEALAANGFDAGDPAVVSSTGVSMY